MLGGGSVNMSDDPIYVEKHFKKRKNYTKSGVVVSPLGGLNGGGVVKNITAKAFK